MWHIRDIIIQNKVVVGPMAGVSNLAFRSVAKEFGAGLIYTEMVSDKALFYGNEKTIRMCEVDPNEHPLSLQLFGEDIETMVAGAIFLDQKTDCDIIDINMGCPVSKVVKGNGGASLLKTPDHAIKICEEVVKAVKKPVTVKIRTGWDKNNIVAKELAIGLEKAGASAIAVHGRTRSQMYQGDIDLDLIKLVKDSVSIPVIGNGNIFRAQDALDMLKYTGCDAIMLARGVLGNPWLIKEILVAIENGHADYVFARNERFAWALTHAERLVALKGEDVAMREMRSHASWYVSGMPSSHKVKNLFSQMTTYQQFVNIIEDYQKEIEDLI